MQNANIAEFEFDYSKNQADWNLSVKHATFSHREACEFIFWIGDDDSIQDWTKKGFSKTFLKVCNEAKAKGFRYLMLFA